MLKIRLFGISALFLQLAWSQDRVDSVHRVDSGQIYHRVFARVPLIGTGKANDPKRPMFAPLPSEMKQDHTGILGFQMEISDDGKWALVEFVGATPKDLQDITDSVDPNVKAFDRQKTSTEEIEAEFKKYKKGFKLDAWTRLRPQ